MAVSPVLPKLVGARVKRRASIVAAAVDALSEFGVKHIDMMLRPEKLWRIITGGQAPSITPRPPRRS